MHRLYVLRHAKSSWSEPGLDDHARPLAPRGRRAADLMREHLREAGIRPALVLCSSARRARETLERVEPGGEHLIEHELYGASAHDIFGRLKRLPEEADSVMVIGHNPALADLVAALSGGAEAAPGKFPTGALATLRFEGPWRELAPGSARLEGLVRPRELESG